MSRLQNVTDFFRHFINQPMLSKIAHHTTSRLPANSQPVTETELLGFIGLLLMFGDIKKNDIEVAELWDASSIHHSDWATATISRDRFKTLIKFIAFDYVYTRSFRRHANRKFHKMNEIFDQFRANINSTLDPGSSLCVDESLYSFRALWT